MKVLDLETGKYLELGKDFYYGGDAIMIHYYTEEELTDYEEVEIFSEHLIIPRRRFNGDYNDETQYKKTVKNGFDKAMDDGECVKMCIEHKSEPQLELKEICEKVGAAVYGGRYVLLMKAYNIKAGDLWNSSKYYNVLLACINYKNNIHFKHNISGGSVPFFEFIRDDNNDNLIVRCSQNEDSIFLGNIFEEYSKKLRNEQNKFDELKAFLK